jgi:hypothetical protein
MPVSSQGGRGKATRSRNLRVKSAAKAPASKTAQAQASREKVRRYRKRMHAKGFRLIQLWLPDTRSPEFAAQAHRDAVAIANSPSEPDDQAFIDSVSWWTSQENAE